MLLYFACPVIIMYLNVYYASPALHLKEHMLVICPNINLFTAEWMYVKICQIIRFHNEAKLLKCISFTVILSQNNNKCYTVKQFLNYRITVGFKVSCYRFVCFGE